MANQIYAILLCRVCGNMVKVINPGNGTLFCCGHPMEQINKTNWGDS